MSPSSWDGPTTGGDQPAVPEDRLVVRRAVVDVVRSRPDMAADPELLDGYLRDICPHQPAEVAVVVAAARAGVAEELATASEGHHSQATAARAARRLNSEAGIDQALATWAVDTWAAAVGAPAFVPSTAPEDTARPAPAPAGRPVTLPPTLAPAPRPTGDAEVLNAMIVQQPTPTLAPEAPEAPRTSAPEHSSPIPAPVPVDPVGRTVQRPSRPPPPPPAPAEAPADLTGRRRRIALVAGSVAASALVIALIAGLAGGGSEEPRTSPTTVETSSSSPPVTTAPSSTLASTTTVTAAPRPFPAGTTPVAPGFYATSTFKPRLTATVVDGWKMHGETSDYFQLIRADSSTDFVSFLKPERALRSNAVFATQAAVRRSGATEPAPADVVPWLRSHSRLRVSDSTPVTKAGAQGLQLDVVASNGYESDFCDGACVPLFSLADGGVFSLLVGHTNRFYVLTVGGEQIVVVIEARNDRFEAVVQQADRLVDTIAFRG